MDSKMKGGIALSIIGGLFDFVYMFILPLSYPELVDFVPLLILIFQVLCVIGGIITLIGAFIAFGNGRAGWIIVVMGAIIGGGNIVALFGGVRLKKAVMASQSLQHVQAYQQSQNTNQNDEDDDQFINKKKQKQKEKELKMLKAQNPNLEIPDY